VAKVLLEISDSRTTATGTNTTFHVLHPESSSWGTIITSVKQILDQVGSGPPLEVISYPEWLAKLKASSDATPVTANPAVKLLLFFENTLSGDDFESPYELNRSLAASNTLRSPPPSLDKECLRALIKGWIEEACI